MTLPPDRGSFPVRGDFLWAVENRKPRLPVGQQQPIVGVGENPVEIPQSGRAVGGGGLKFRPVSQRDFVSALRADRGAGAQHEVKMEVPQGCAGHAPRKIRVFPQFPAGHDDPRLIVFQQRRGDAEAVGHHHLVGQTF